MRTTRRRLGVASNEGWPLYLQRYTKLLDREG